MGGFTGKGWGGAANPTKDFREEKRTAITAVCKPLPSMWLANPLLDTHSEIMTSLGDTNVKDNHTQMW